MEKNLGKTDSIRKIGEFECNQLLEKVVLLPENEWNQEEDFELNYNKAGKALSQVKHITFRFINRQSTPYQYQESRRWQKWKDILLPIMKKIAVIYGYRKPVFPKVMLANLPAGSFIPPHVDGDKRGHVPHKVHLPIITNSNAYFFIEEKRYHFEAEKAYEVNNGLRHTVVNQGETDRIHLIFECLDYDLQTEEIKKQMQGIL